MIKPLLEAEALFLSPGSAPHLVKKAPDGRLFSFPVIEDTYTVIPAQHRLRSVEQIKAAYKTAGLDCPVMEPAAGGEGEDRGGDPTRDGASGPEVAAAKALIDILLTEIQMEDLP